jgi:hypothetical protein
MCAPVVSTLHDRFLALLPKIERHGQIVFRHLKQHKKEEALQDMRALGWRWFLRLARRGKDASKFISTFNTFLALAIRNGRRIMGQAKAKDVMCELAQQRHGFRIESLPSTRTSREHLYADVQGQHEHDAFEERLHDNTVTPVPDQAAFRIDWPVWLRTRSHRDRQMIGELIKGHQGNDVGRKFGLSPARLSQLRRAFKEDWERFGAETEEQPADLAA